MSRRHKVVEANTPREKFAYALLFDLEEFMDSVAAIEQHGWVVLNSEEEVHLDEQDLRLHLRSLTIADAIVLPSIWWTSATAHQLVQVASWLRLDFLNESGQVIPKMGVA